MAITIDNRQSKKNILSAAVAAISGTRFFLLSDGRVQSSFADADGRLPSKSDVPIRLSSRPPSGHI